MRKTSVATLALAAAAGMVSPASADTIVQTATLSGGLGSQNHDIFINQFDTQGGTLQLNFVQLDFLTSVIGGYETDGSGIPVHIHVELSAEYFLNGQSLSAMQAMVDTIVANTSPGAASVFNTDTDQLIYTQPSDLTPWIGNGQIMLTATTFFDVWEEPAGIINFGAGGTARWTVTYDYSVVPAPGALAAMAIGLTGLVRSRRRY